MSPRAEPDDRRLISRELAEERMLREALKGDKGKDERKKPPPGRHWYKDRQSGGGVKKG